MPTAQCQLGFQRCGLGMLSPALHPAAVLEHGRIPVVSRPPATSRHKETVNSTANTSPGKYHKLRRGSIGISYGCRCLSITMRAETTNNHVADALWLSGSYSLRFKAMISGQCTTFFAAAGGQASGITGITSSSGTGTWTHMDRLTVQGTSQPHRSSATASFQLTNLPGGLLGSMPYQSAASTTANARWKHLFSDCSAHSARQRNDQCIPALERCYWNRVW